MGKSRQRDFSEVKKLIGSTASTGTENCITSKCLVLRVECSVLLLALPSVNSHIVQLCILWSFPYLPLRPWTDVKELRNVQLVASCQHFSLNNSALYKNLAEAWIKLRSLVQCELLSFMRPIFFFLKLHLFFLYVIPLLEKIIIMKKSLKCITFYTTTTTLQDLVFCAYWIMQRTWVENNMWSCGWRLYHKT